MPASSSEATDRCRKLLKKTQSSEKALKELLVTKRRSPSDPKVVSLRSSIRDSYEEIIFLDYAFATRKDVELSLWKSAFYKPIEEYRYRIRKLTAAAPKSPDAAAQKADVCKRFRGFLAEAGGFYTGLLRKMQTEFKLEMGGLLEMGGPLSMPGSHANAVADGVSSWRGRVAPGYASCHRSLIFLGDLNRYREQHRDSTDGHDYSSAAKYYSRAVRLLPTIGNPFNQLAVLATYDEDECDALYRYCRSLCLDSPFDTARDNMRLLFEKNAQKMRRLGQNSKRDAGVARSILVRFRTRFVRLHGILHTGQGLETFGDVQNQVMNDLAYLHKGGLLDRTLALRLFATNAFSLFQLHTSFGGGHTAAGKGGSGRAEAGATAAAACACVFSLCCATFSMLVGLELKASSTPSAPGSGSGSGSGSGTSMLSALVVVGEWFSRDLLLLVSPDCGASFELPVWHSALASLSQLLRRAAAAAEDNSSTISSNYANAVSPAAAAASSTTVPVLEEDIELQGFLPFKLCHLSFDAQWQHASAPPPADGKGNGKGQGQNDDEMALGIRRAAMARLQLLAEDLTANRGNSAAAGDSIDNIDGSGAAAGLWFDGESVSFPADPNAVTSTAASSVAAASAAATSGQGHGRHGLRRESRLPAAAAAATEEMVIEDESYGYDYNYTSGGATHEHEEEEVEQPMDLGLGGGGPAQAPPQQQEEEQEDDDDDDMMDDEVILFAPPRAASSRAAAPVIGNGNGHGNGGSSSSGGGSLPTPGDAAAAAGAAAGVPPLLQQHRYQQQALQHGTHGGGYEYASAAGTHTGNNGGGGGGGGGNGVVGSDGNNNPFSAGFGGFGGFGGLTGMAGSAAGAGGGGGDADAMNDETFGDAAMGSHHHASTAGHGQGHGQGLGDGGEGSSLIDMLAAGTAELPPGFQQVQTAPAAAMPGAAGGSNGSAALLADQLLSARFGGVGAAAGGGPGGRAGGRMPRLLQQQKFPFG